MTRKALLIGTQAGDLSGVLNDVEAMRQALEPRGFTVEQLVTPHATRPAILQAYEKLIADARDGDAFVVYYSGHGGLAQSPTGPDLQFIAPDDYVDSDEDNFRGITGVELSVLLARLTDAAPNATVILDCCHAAHMSRQPADLRVKSLLRPAHWLPTYETVEHHVARLVEDGLPVHLRPLVSNPRAVRAVACAPSGAAWESANRDGVVMGLFTDALTRALREADGLRLTWSTLIDAVRRHVQVFADTQRPEVEGPSERQPFEMTVLEPLDALPVVALGPDRVQLLGAPLLGVELGDEFAIMPAGAAGPQDGPPIGSATVDRLLPMAALAKLRPTTSGQDLLPDARAHRTRAAAAALPVRIPEGHPVTADLAKELALRPLLRQADPATDAKVTVEVVADTDGRLVVRDAAGPLHAPYPATSADITSIMVNLQRLAQATALRRLAADPTRPLAHHVVLEWGRVRDGRPEPLPPSGALLFAHADERVYFRLRNEGDRPVFVSLINIGVSYRIRLLTGSDPGGVRIAPDASYTYGWNEDLQQLTGVAMAWPDGVDTELARPETVIALISDAPVDVSVLSQRGVRAVDRHATGSALWHLLDQIATGKSREIGEVPAGQVRFDVLPIDFTTSPTAPPTSGRRAFLIDDRPDLPVRLLSPRGAEPTAVAVRINELIVHRNRALGSADIRLDAVVQTGGSTGQPNYQARTMRFSNVSDKCRLPLDNVLIYHGPAVDFLDLAVWVSRDATDSLALSDLLADKLTDPVLQAGLGQALALTCDGPQAAAAVAMLSAGAVLVNTAYDLLTGVVGRSIGLYRTSLLAQEQFGIGRHERHPQDFSFTFSVEAVTNTGTPLPSARPASITREGVRA
ncbi:caspase family protein [Jatrophihabitans sp.]|uniref:caspase family protein n=1 Tax=Jatrophihabitans sp. TaxID=1932789 RepID=UPI002EE4B57F